jgi:hypothetical protein
MVFRKRRSNLDTDEAVGQVGYLETTIDPVMVSEGDKSHPLLFEATIKSARS